MRNCYFNSTSLPSSCCPGGQPQYAHLTAPISLMKLQSGQFRQAPRRLPRQSTSILVSFGAEKKSDTRWNILVDWLILYASHHLFVDFKNHCPIEKRFIKFDFFFENQDIVQNYHPLLSNQLVKSNPPTPPTNSVIDQLLNHPNSCAKLLF